MSQAPTANAASGSAGSDLTHHLEVLRRRWLTILLITLIVIGSAAWVTAQQTPRYTAKVEFVVGSIINPTGSVTNVADEVINRLGAPDTTLASQPSAIESVVIAERAAILLNTSRSPLSLLDAISARLTTENVLIVEAKSTDPQQAVNIAEAFAAAYLGARSDEAITTILRATEQFTIRRDVAADRLDEVEFEIARLTPAPGLEEESTVRPTLDPELVGLQSEAQRLQAEISAIDIQIANLNASGAIQSANGQIIRPAELPTKPSTPQPLRNLGLALVLGLTLGVGLAYVRDHLDDALRSESDVARIVNQPILGRHPRWDHATRGRLITVTDPTSPVAESYRTLRTNVGFITGASDVSSVLVTSPQTGEGKTTTASNLAVAFARLGQRTLLIDADMRRPQVDHAFSIPRAPGLSEALASGATDAQVLRDVGIPNLRVLPAGTTPPNPSELLGSPKMRELLDHYASMSDLVIVDAPPLLAVSDSVALAQRVGATVIVVEQGRSGRSSLRAAVAQLKNLDITPAGIVMNAISENAGGYAYAEYYREYIAEVDAASNNGNGDSGKLSRRERRKAAAKARS